MWWRSVCWKTVSPLDREEVASRLSDYLATRRHQRRWPFLLGNRYSTSESGFTILPDWLLRNPYRFTVTGRIESDGATSLLICLRLGVGVLIEGFVIGGFFVVAAASVAIVVETYNSNGQIDLSPLLLGVPFLVVAVIAILARLWLAWRSHHFVNGIVHRLDDVMT